MSTQFKRTIEDFLCEKCGFNVTGDGYTNHCPECLWSKHVDVNPGDREHACEGLMEPIRIEVKNNEYTVIHRCSVCGVERPNKAVKEDNFQIILQIASENASKI